MRSSTRLIRSQASRRSKPLCITWIRTPTGYGTAIAEGKEVRDFAGRPYVMETALHADFALIKAWKGDKWGNLIYRKTARNFNPMMATAGKVTIAEVQSAMANPNVSFKVCEIAMKNNSIVKSQLLSGVQTVPDGIYEIVSTVMDFQFTSSVAHLKPSSSLCSTQLSRDGPTTITRVWPNEPLAKWINICIANSAAGPVGAIPRRPAAGNSAAIGKDNKTAQSSAMVQTRY